MKHILDRTSFEKAEREYDIFNRTQPVFSDFDAEIRRITDEGSRGK